MSEAKKATEKAIYTALIAAPLEFTTHQHVPEDTPPPVNIIDDISGEPLGDKGGVDEKIEVSIVTIYQGEERVPIFDEQARIIAALDGKALTSVAGWTIHPERLSEDAVPLGDGETYVGTARFTIFALKN